MFNLDKLIKTNISIKGEEATLSNLRSYWRITEQALINAGIRRGISEIDSLFQKLGVELRTEEKISEEKLRLVRAEYELIMKEEGTTEKAA